MILACFAEWPIDGRLRAQATSTLTQRWWAWRSLSMNAWHQTWGNAYAFHACSLQMHCSLQYLQILLRIRFERTTWLQSACQAGPRGYRALYSAWVITLHEVIVLCLDKYRQCFRPRHHVPRPIRSLQETWSTKNAASMLQSCISCIIIRPPCGSRCQSAAAQILSRLYHRCLRITITTTIITSARS